MTAVLHPRMNPLRRAPRPGEAGYLAACPVCGHGRGAPPCLACREELRARRVGLDLARLAHATRN